MASSCFRDVAGVTTTKNEMEAPGNVLKLVKCLKAIEAIFFVTCNDVEFNLEQPEIKLIAMTIAPPRMQAMLLHVTALSSP